MHYRAIHLFVIAALAVVLSGCKNTSTHNPELEAIDSLLNIQENGKALMRLKEFNAGDISVDDKAYYDLLLTMAKYKNYCQFNNDSAINTAVDHYKKTNQTALYLRALIAKGCVNEELGNLDKAVECYHQTEKISGEYDSLNMAYAKLRLGYLYQSQFIGTETIALRKYIEALALYQSIGDKHYELVCLSEIGRIYCSIKEKHDSAVIYLKKACELAKTDKDPYFLFGNNFSLSEYYVVRAKDYRAAVDYGRQALAVDASVVEHPRAHYRLAEAYLHLGRLDSAQYYLNSAPRRVETVDSIVYLDVMSQLEHARHNDGLSRQYIEQAHAIADSVTINGLNHRLLAVEKKYDLQQQELKSSQLLARLRGTWLILAAITIAALLLLLGLLRYRSRLRLKEHERALLQTDLDASLAGLQHMQARIDEYERELDSTKAACVQQIAANQALEQQYGQLNIDIATLEEKKRQSDELRTIITQQIDAVNKIMTWSYQHDAATFTRKFREIMSIQAKGAKTTTYWANLHVLVNDLHDGILDKAQEKAHGNLSESELNLLALYCCGFSRTVIMVTMGYKHIGTVYNKKNQIAQKLGVNDLDEFLGSRL